MYKKIISLLICTAALLCGTFGVNAQETENNVPTEANEETQGTKVYTLSLDDAIKMSLERDPSIMSADVTIQDAERQLVQAKKNQKDMEGIAIKVSQGISGFALQRGYYVKQAEIGVESAKMSKTKTIASVSYNITQMYYNVKMLERILNNTDSTYELAKNNLDNVNTQFSLGLVSGIDLANAKYAVNQVKSARLTNERNLNMARKTLAANLFINDDNYELVLTDDIEYSVFSADLKTDKENAMKNRFDIFSLESACSQAEFMAEIVDLFGLTSSEYSSANQAKVQSLATRDKNKVLIEVYIESSYNAILNADDTLALALENLELQRQEYRAAETQYGLGMITNSQLTAALNDVMSAEIEVENAKFTHKLAVKKYGYEITIGL